MKVAFALKSKPKPTQAPPPSLKRPAAFASLDDDEPLDAAPTLSTHKNVDANKQLLAQNVVSKTEKKRMDAEMQVDPTVYDYDGVYDKMQEAKARQKEAREQDSKERKPKYIGGLLTSAAQRKRDHLLAEEKMMQYEREAEGDQFKDKEAFVTQAYKDQMAAAHREAEEERKQEELRKKPGGSSTGMAHFYRQLLEQSEQDHEATVAASQKPVKGPQGAPPNLTITKPPEPSTLTDTQLAALARKEGKEVELNDDGQIVDKRELLSAGLNLSGVNTRRLGLSANTKATETQEFATAHRAAGVAASRKEINERRAREIRQQMSQEETRLADEKQRADEEALRRVVAKRNDTADVQSARDRYLARKRQKLEQADETGGN